MGLIKYQPDLQEKLGEKQILPSGSEEETEIRAASILACEKLKHFLGCGNAVELDFYLWVNLKVLTNLVLLSFLGAFAKD